MIPARLPSDLTLHIKVVPGNGELSHNQRIESHNYKSFQASIQIRFKRESVLLKDLKRNNVF